MWAGRPPRVEKQILYLPMSGGGLALPNFQLYYWAAILVTVQWWFSQPKQNPATTLEAAILRFYAALSNLVFKGLRASPLMTSLMRTTVRVWQEARVVYRWSNRISPHITLCYHI